MKLSLKTEKYFYYPAILISALFLLIPAFYNHYPLVNPDTATYLASGFKPETPFDRPITYGLFARLLSLNGFSLWLLVFMQGYIVSWLIFRLIKAITTNQHYLLYPISVIAFLSICTPLSWIVSQVQPDVFTSVACLCVLLILLNKETKGNIILLYCLFFIAAGMHMSHPVLFCIIFLCLLFSRKLYVVPGHHITSAVKALSLMSILALCSIIFMGSAMSKSKHIFFTASLLEKGVLKTYLDENCANNNFKICVYKDSLPLTLDEFIWSENSPLYKIGAWAGTKKEFNTIIHNVLTTPRYLLLYIKATIKQAGRQAVTFNIGDGNTSFPPGSNVQNRIAEYFHREYRAFDTDRQNTSHLANGLARPNSLFSAIVLVSLFVLLSSFYKWQKRPREIKALMIVILLSIVCNIADCAAFTTVNGRYGCKMIWLIPLCACITIAQQIKESKQNGCSG